MAVKIKAQPTKQDEAKAEKFISQGGSLPENDLEQDSDHRLTLRIPKWLLEKLDEKREDRVGKISRNLWILRQIEKAIKD